MKDYFYTSSMNIAAWLLSKGFEVEQKTRLDNQTVLYFKRSPELQQALNDYNNNKELKSFITCYGKVRDVIRGK